MEQIINSVTELVVAVVVALIGVVAVKVKAYFQAQVNTDLRKTVVGDAVRFAQQVYKDLSGSEKLAAVRERVLRELNARSIPIHPDQLDTMIESAVFEIKSYMPDPPPDLPEDLDSQIL
jgi:hypothetical protein